MGVLVRVVRVEGAVVAYVSLYRKYRPQTFTEVVGQDHVTRTIVNALDEDRLHHAYLFTGPRGTGKTSTARILAKSVNCVEGPTSTPCNVCEQCTAITAGSSVDVIELDMASHGGVDDARELRDRALFAPASARRKVYILDEVHMASTAAFNALLKLIEEPPGHVIFAMATTDPQKVLPTIMSRVQRLDLRRVSAPVLASHVRDLAAREGVAIDDLAVDAVVRAGDGSVRDTLSVLEQVLAFAGGDVTGDHVGKVLGHTPFESTAAAVDAIAQQQLAAALSLVQQLVDDGHDLRRFAFDLLQHLRDLLVRQVAPQRPDLVDATEQRRDQLTAQSARIDRPLVIGAMQLLAATVAEMRQGPARLPLELALATLTSGVPAPSAPEPPDASESGPPEPALPEPDVPEPDLPEPALSEPDRPVPPESAAAAAPATDDPAPATDDPAPPSTDGVGDAQAAPLTGLGDDLAARANAAAARTAAHGGPPDPPRDRPDGPQAEYAAPPPPDAAADLASIEAHWEQILEQVREVSPRIHAIYVPAIPARLARGILTLRYAPRYRSFHVDQAMRGDHQEALATAVQQACGVRIRVDATVEGDPPPRPTPPTVEADLAPAPVPAAEQTDVREAEAADDAPVAVEDAIDRASTLLATELGATRVAEDEV